MVCFSNYFVLLIQQIHPCTDVFRAMSEAIRRVKEGMHDPFKAHNRIREFYSWQQVAERTERVYDFARSREESDLWSRIVQ